MAELAEPALPDDVLHVLCEELANQEQFDTLFNCACSSRVLAVPALTHLYRYATIDLVPKPAPNTDTCCRSHHSAPVRGGGDDLYGLPLATKLLSIQRWSILWRSIIASALDATLFPYCRYIKNLDFRDLGNLLDEDQFRNKVYKYDAHLILFLRCLTFALRQFFSGPLKQFERTDTFTSIKGKKFTRLKNAEIIDGESRCTKAMQDHY
jgi:hypothetical protein